MGNVYSRRRMVCVMPVEAIVGKMAPKNQKVNRNNAGFKCFVGYQLSGSVFNRFQVKSRPRTTPVSTDEQNLRTIFTTVVKATRTRLADPEKMLQDQQAFAKQTKYKTLYQYVFNQEYDKVK